MEEVSEDEADSDGFGGSVYGIVTGTLWAVSTPVRWVAGGVASLVRPHETDGSAAAAPVDVESERPPEALEQEAVVQRQTRSAFTDPTLLMYEVSEDPPSPIDCHAPLSKLRTARYVPMNGRCSTPFKNEMFQGEVILMHRSPTGENRWLSPYDWHFENKKRLWEVRVQGRFLQKPTGALWGGVVLEDFDYTVPPTRAAIAAAAFGRAAMQAMIRVEQYFTWGDRGKDLSHLKEPELAHLVYELSVFDQIIATASGELPPPIDGDLEGCGLSRNKISLAQYREDIDLLSANINTEDTYTLCLWGPSRVADWRNGIIRDLLPFGMTVNIESFMEGYPLHFALYELAHEEGETRHLESRKRYVADVVFWSSSCRCSSLFQRYNFLDAPDEAIISGVTKQSYAQRGLQNPKQRAGCMEWLKKPVRRVCCCSSGDNRQRSPQHGEQDDNELEREPSFYSTTSRISDVAAGGLV